jgi:hypothetical protein
MRQTPDSYGEFEVSELFCANCKRATPVRKRLLLVLPSGSKLDDDTSAFTIFSPK